jgi:type IV pilus assembly protein PilM
MVFGKKKSVAGLDIGSSSVKMVELEGKGNRYSLTGLGFENVPDETIIDGQIMELNTVSDVIQKVCVNHNIKLIVLLPESAAIRSLSRTLLFQR